MVFLRQAPPARDGAKRELTPCHQLERHETQNRASTYADRALAAGDNGA
jgi:hypothetical protein